MRTQMITMRTGTNPRATGWGGRRASSSSEQACFDLEVQRGADAGAEQCISKEAFWLVHIRVHYSLAARYLRARREGKGKGKGKQRNQRTESERPFFLIIIVITTASPCPTL